jgi:hypothetical protein
MLAQLPVQEILQTPLIIGRKFAMSLPVKMSSSLRQRAKRIKLFPCDVDGVMTQGTVLPRLTPNRIRAD